MSAFRKVSLQQIFDKSVYLDYRSTC